MGKLAAMLPLELTLIERNRFVKGMTLPAHLAAEKRGTVRLELVIEEGDRKENE